MIEVVGPAGAGKTSLVSALGRLHPAWRVRPRPGRLAHVLGGVARLPLYARLQRGARRSVWKEMKRVVYLDSLRREAGRWAGAGGVVVFDEGPLYMMARLRQYGGSLVDHPALAAWWRGTLDWWAGALAMVVRLDAPDEELRRRVRARPRQHRLQQFTDDGADAFLQSYRSIYLDLLDELRRRAPAMVVLECRTDGKEKGAVVEQVENGLRGLGVMR